MANQQQLDILKQGVDVWNEWRDKNGHARVDLSKAYLSQADLLGARLSQADLTQADLSGADLGGTCLIRADLRGANLEQADLTDAMLADEDGASANVAGAKFSSTRFTTASKSHPDAGILELVAADGFEKALFINPEELHYYLAEAFEYTTQRADLQEAEQYPDFFKKAIEKI